MMQFARGSRQYRQGRRPKRTGALKSFELAFGLTEARRQRPGPAECRAEIWLYSAHRILHEISSNGFDPGDARFFNGVPHPYLLGVVARIAFFAHRFAAPIPRPMALQSPSSVIRPPPPCSLYEPTEME
jgi:hypothetical protein